MAYYCRKCGSKILDGSSYCQTCGTKIEETRLSDSTSLPRMKRADSNSKKVSCVQMEKESSLQHPHISENSRKTVYEGVVHKCPNCDTVLNGFEARCPGCGLEFRSEDTLNSVTALSDRLGSLERTSAKKSEASIYAARAGVIMSFPIPNTKEDIFEFMLIASTSVHVDILVEAEYGYEDFKAAYAEQKAWMTKMDQALKKAQLLFSEDPLFEKIQTLYNDKQNEIVRYRKDHEKKDTLAIIKPILFLVLLFVAFGILLSFCSRQEKNEQKKEVERLESIAEEIEIDIEEGKYDSAKNKARRLHFDENIGGSKTYVKEWDEIREGYLEDIEELEKKKQNEVRDKPVEDITEDIEKNTNKSKLPW